ncbi:hybrid sensor histidine kinase/response regulator transcription factor [Sphingobacterium bambusae]|uniref:histidine kinase n=1 Tax=Sphingobacterium bambusae TaxID=662858 RepID=A0ABW6BBG2_9SPHI|nr:two-component regulator propeller domain-containing protein [Sphingobacterium bambusae]WPL48559.1 two-component regulator propeller domain-containing protein [Sphingobacterium bambusae]
MSKLFYVLVAGIILLVSAISQHAEAQNHYPFTHLTIENGLHSNHINAIMQDSDHYMWFGTSTGLSKFDGKRFQVYRYNAQDNQSLPGNSVQEFFHGPAASLWIKTYGGWAMYNKQKDAFIRNIDSVLVSFGLPRGPIDKIRQLENKRYAFIYADGTAVLLDSELGKTKKLDHVAILDVISSNSRNELYIVDRSAKVTILDRESLRQKETFTMPVNVGHDILIDYRIFLDSKERLWLYAKNFPLGVFSWHRTSKQVIHFSRRSSQHRLNSDNVSNVQELNGEVWLGTDHGGINLIKDDRVEYLVNQPFDNYTLPFNSTTALYCSKDGLMWVGTYKGGTSFYSKDRTYIKAFQQQLGNPNSLPFDDVNCFAQRASGELLIGTNGGGLLVYDPVKEKFASFTNHISDKFSISGNVIVSLFPDKTGAVWVGTYRGGLNRMNNDGTFTRFGDAISTNLSVWDIFEDSRGRFWIGTLSHGLHLFDRKKGTFTPFLSKANKRLPSTYYSKIFEDSRGNIWLGTATGIEIIGHDGEISLFREGRGTSGLSNNMVSDIVEDRFGRIWVSTQQGVNVIEGRHVTKLNENTGLLHEVVVELVLDRQGDIWVATEKGISKVTVRKNLKDCIFHNFNVSDGLQSISFNENAGLLLNDGSLVFGGPRGFNKFGPTDADLLPKNYQIYLSNVTVAKSGSANKEREDLGGTVFQLADASMKVAYNHNSITINLTDFDYLGNNKGKFQYVVENLDMDWKDLSVSDFSISLPNLSPGDYLVNVRYQDSDGALYDGVKLLKVTVLAPWWRSGVAYCCYLLAICVFLFYLRRFEKLRERTRFNLLEAERYAKNMKDLDEMKTRFFMNVSHEFRTPISLILSPISVLKKEIGATSMLNYVEIIERNAKQLYSLVGQLLDFNRMDKDILQLSEQTGKLSPVIQPILDSFANLAKLRDMIFLEDAFEADLFYVFDQNKLEAVLNNLLSNAFKFTAQGGTIKVRVMVSDLDILSISVMDTGKGISPENLSKIFERFYQEDASNRGAATGSGIGLAIVKDFVDLMKGKIDVQSSPGKGTTFSVHIPIVRKTEIVVHHGVPKRRPARQGGIKVEAQRRVLVIEDNSDFAFFLQHELLQGYQLEICASAELALERINAFHPDLIVSDMSLPGISGIELCTQVRQDERTKHIPFIIITAVAEINLQLESLKAGATDFITKPFHAETFRSKIKAVIKQHDVMQRKFKRQVDIKVSKTEPEHADEKFLRKATHIIESNLVNQNLTVAFLAAELHMSRVGLYKRILTLTGGTPIEFIRNIRLKMALDLLQHSAKNVSEITYEVGFSSPKQFSKYFKALYGNVPSFYRK